MLLNVLLATVVAFTVPPMPLAEDGPLPGGEDLAKVSRATRVVAIGPLSVREL